MIGLDEVFGMEFFIEIEFFAKYHPFIHIHLVALHLDLGEITVWLEGLLTKTLEGHLQVLVVEYFCFLGDFHLLFCLEHVWTAERVVLVGLLGELKEVC